MSEELEPFDSKVRLLLERERNADVSPSSEIRTRIRMAVIDTAMHTATRASADSPDAPTEASTGSWSTKAIALASTFAMGTIVGAIAHAIIVEKEISVRETRVNTTHDIEATDPPETPAEEPEIEAPIPPTRAVSRRSRSTDASVVQAPAVMPSAAIVVESESTIIDQARVALRRNMPHEALLALMRHEREYASGPLAEERERLIIEALVAQGRIEIARRRARDFFQHYPESVHRTAIERTLNESR
jgi:hypothetical protein